MTDAQMAWNLPAFKTIQLLRQARDIIDDLGGCLGDCGRKDCMEEGVGYWRAEVAKILGETP